MTHMLSRSLSATAAISAVLALGSTPAMAQDAAPTIQVPPPTSTTAAPSAANAPLIVPQATPAAKPTVVLPDVTAAPAPQPVASAEPAPRAEAAQPKAKAATQTPAQAQKASVSSRPATEATAARDSAPAPRDNAVAPDAAPVKPEARNPISQPAPVTQARATQPAPAGDGIPGEAIAGVLAALGLGAIGFAALRSRRRREDYVDDEPALEAAAAAPALARDPEVAPPAQPVGYAVEAAPAATIRDTQVMDRPPVMAAPVMSELRRERTSTTAAPAIPAEELSFDERTQLLDRMVEAEPDEANPFVSRKARRKRARLLLQRAEYQQHQKADAPFDWRDYRPSTKPTTPASPPLVTA